MGKVYKDDWGHSLRLTVGKDLTGVISQKVLVKKPNGVLVDWSASIVSPATSGILLHIVASGDFNVSGTYIFMAYVEYGSGVTATIKIKGESATLRVYEKWE